MIMLTNIQTMAKLRSDFGLKIGSSTGYTSEIMAKLRLAPYFTICDTCVFSEKKNEAKFIMLKLGHSVVYMNYKTRPLAAAGGYAPDSYVTRYKNKFRFLC